MGFLILLQDEARFSLKSFSQVSRFLVPLLAKTSIDLNVYSLLHNAIEIPISFSAELDSVSDLLGNIFLRRWRENPRKINFFAVLWQCCSSTGVLALLLEHWRLSTAVQAQALLNERCFY